MAQTTCFCNYWYLLGSRWYTVIFRGQPPKNIFGAWITKHAKYKNVHIVETTVSISASDRDHQIVFVGGPNVPITNPIWRRAPSWKIEKRPYLGNGLTDRHGIWQGDAHWPSEPYRQLKFWTFKNPRWLMAVILKIEKSQQRFADWNEIWYNEANWAS